MQDRVVPEKRGKNDDETLANFIKQSNPTKEGKEGTKREEPSRSQKSKTQSDKKAR